MIAWLIRWLSPPPRMVEVEEPVVPEPPVEQEPLPWDVVEVLRLFEADALRLMAQEIPTGARGLPTKRGQQAVGIRYAGGRMLRRVQLLRGSALEETPAEKERRRRMCTSKVQFESEWLANRTAGRERQSLRPYECEYCGLFHLTSDVERLGAGGAA